MSEHWNQLKKATEFLEGSFGKAPKLAIVLGSGLKALGSQLKNSLETAVKDIPGGTPSSVPGHEGRLIVGELNDYRLATLSGRLHGYEGHSPEQVVFILRSLRLWGVCQFILTNASGSTQTDYKPGELALIKDHINLTGLNPLVGQELYKGPRFPDLSDLYSLSWRQKIQEKLKQWDLEVSVKEGVYGGVMGPNYETAAEIQMLRRLGADFVGMSTVWEALALKQMQSDILGISCVTNYGTGVSDKSLSHEEVLETTEKVRPQFIELMKRIVAETADS